MNWQEQKDPYYIRSVCGLYTVAKVGGARGFSYESWFGREQLAVHFQTADAARTHCETHFAAQQVAA